MMQLLRIWGGWARGLFFSALNLTVCCTFIQTCMGDQWYWIPSSFNLEIWCVCLYIYTYAHIYIYVHLRKLLSVCMYIYIYIKELSHQFNSLSYLNALDLRDSSLWPYVSVVPLTPPLSFHTYHDRGQPLLKWANKWFSSDLHSVCWLVWALASNSASSFQASAFLTDTMVIRAARFY